MLSLRTGLRTSVVRLVSRIRFDCKYRNLTETNLQDLTVLIRIDIGN